MKWGFLDDDSGYFYCIIYTEPALFGIVFGGVLFFVLSVFLNWFVVGLLAFLVVMAFGIVVAYANHKWNKQVWPELMDAWDHSYICLLRCGECFEIR